MVGERNRIVRIVEYLESLGIQVNLCKNKARGNKGFFKAENQIFRIDINKDLTEDAILKTLSHEFAHYIHYCEDKTLKSLSSIFEDNNDELLEELLKITVETITRDSVKPLFNTKQEITTKINKLESSLKSLYPDFKKSHNYVPMEKIINKSEYKYLLKHDNVKVFTGFGYKKYSINNIDCDENISLYLKLKSYHRALKRINSKISRLNKYYNQPSELFARSFELYVKDPNLFIKKFPLVGNEYNKILKKDKFKELATFVNLVIE